MYPPSIAATRPDALAFVMAGSGERLTYADLDSHSNRLAHALRDAGVRPGDTLMIAMENRIEWPIVVAAGMRSGLYVTPVNTHLRPAELAALIAEADPAVVITSPSLAGIVQQALAGRPALRVAVGDPVDGFEHFLSWIALCSDEPIDDETLGARVLYSGGSTGRPKAFRQQLLGIHPADAPARHGELMQKLGLQADTVLLSPAPNYHAAPFTFQLATLAAGGTVVCLERFDAAAAMRAILDHGVTLSQWVPTMLVRLVELHRTAEVPLSPAHRVAVTSGGPCTPELKSEIDAWWGPILHEYYGASEGYGHTYVSPLEAREHGGSVGRPLGETRIHITDDGGTELGPGEIGTVWFESAGRAYRNQGEADSGPAGWRNMGDLGEVDDDGFLYLRGRRGYTIVSGGVNIYPEEIEAALLRHPEVADAAVFGETDAEFGERVVAVVELRAGADAQGIDERLDEHVRQELASFKRPRRLVVIDAMPRLPTGKLDKSALRAAHTQN